jgi:hypothetical protein
MIDALVGKDREKGIPSRSAALHEAGSQVAGSFKQRREFGTPCIVPTLDSRGEILSPECSTSENPEVDAY